MKATYQSAAVFIKQVKSYSPYVSDIFRKEALVLSQMKHGIIIRLLGVCDDPVSIMIEFCCFSLRPLQRNEQFNLLEQMLLFLHSQDLFSLFPTIGNSIVKDIVAAVSYLHENYIVHRDLKPGNVLLDNSHYSSTLDSVEMCRGIFNEKPIICKLEDLGEGRLQATQTKTMVSNVTKMVNRGSPAFMAPEISLEYMLETASIEKLKAIDNWALLMTIFIVMNPDQKYPFELDVKEQQNTKKKTSQLNLLRQHLKEKLFPSSSPSYLSMQASYLQKIREVFHKAESFVPEERKTVHCLKSLLENQAHVFIVPLSVSQLTALEQYERGKINGGSDFQIMSRPDNDAANACSFLCLGIIDCFSSEDLQTFDME